MTIGTVRKRGKYWHIDYYDETGARIREAAGSDRKQAEAELKIREAGVVTGQKHIPLKPRTNESYESVLRQYLIPAFGGLRLGAIEQIHAKKYRAFQVGEAKRLLEERQRREVEDARPDRTAKKKERMLRPLSTTSINYHLAVLSIALNEAVNLGYIPRNPLQRLKKLRIARKPEDEMRVLSPFQVRAMLDASPEDLRPLLTMAVMTGMRKGELLGLRWDDVDFATGKLNVRRSLGRVKTESGYQLEEGAPKSGKGRRVDMPPEVAAAIWELPSRAGAGLVFCQSNGSPLDPSNLVKRDFARVLRQAKLPHIRFHDLRHTFASLQLARGASPKYVQTQLGHASLTTTCGVYSHFIPDMHQEEATKLGVLLFGEGRGHNLVTNGVSRESRSVASP